MKVYDPMDDPLVAAVAAETGEAVRLPDGAAQIKLVGDGTGPIALGTLFVRCDALSGDQELYVHATFGRDASITYRRQDGIATVHTTRTLPEGVVASAVGRPIDEIVVLPGIEGRIVAAAEEITGITIMTLERETARP